jgi:6-phosphofructokinase 1
LCWKAKTDVCPNLYRRIKKKGYAVIVVAEGAGEEILGTSTETDASGNKKLPQIGEFLKKDCGRVFQKEGRDRNSEIH